MRKRIGLILTAVLIIAAAVVVVIFLNREQKIPLSQVPIDVINALNEKLPGGEVVSVIMEKEDDEILYEIVVNGLLKA